MTVGSNETDQRARQIIARSIVWDNHSCMPLRADDDFLPQLERCRRAGYTAVTLNIGFDATAFDQNVRVVAHFRRWVETHGDDYVLIDGPRTILDAKRDGRLAVGFDLEGTRAIGDQISMISFYRDLGVLWMLMAYNKNNSVGGGCMDEDGGLSAFGKAVLDEMIRVGMIACCSHTGWRTAREVIDYVDRPIIFSHSNAHAVHPHHRNIPDELIRACAEAGGVIGINGVSRFVGNDSIRSEDLFRHIDHVVQLVGPAHVGIALDYVWDLQEVKDFILNNPDTFPPAGGYAKLSRYAAPEQVVELVALMLRHDYPEDAISAILGLNHLRVAQSWDAGRQRLAA